MTKRKLIIADQAKDDLVEIWLYIANDSPVAADNFIDHLHEKCLSLCSAPEIGRIRNEFLPGIRCLPVKRYLIFYRDTGQNIEVARIISSYRDIESLL